MVLVRRWLLIVTVHETNREKRTRRQVQDARPMAGEARKAVRSSKAGKEVTQEARIEGEGVRCRHSLPETSRPRSPMGTPWQPRPCALGGVGTRGLFLQYSRYIDISGDRDRLLRR